MTVLVGVDCKILGYRLSKKQTGKKDRVTHRYDTHGIEGLYSQVALVMSILLERWTPRRSSVNADGGWNIKAPAPHRRTPCTVDRRYELWHAFQTKVLHFIRIVKFHIDSI